MKLLLVSKYCLLQKVRKRSLKEEVKRFKTFLSSIHFYKLTQYLPASIIDLGALSFSSMVVLLRFLAFQA